MASRATDISERREAAGLLRRQCFRVSLCVQVVHIIRRDQRAFVSRYRLRRVVHRGHVAGTECRLAVRFVARDLADCGR